MSKEIDDLKRKCGDMLRANNVKVSSVKGKSMVYSFWQGVNATTQPSPYVQICLLSGRFDELVL